MERKNSSSLRRDFEFFSRGIQRLEELRAELDSLDTKGYEADAASIRAKLKNVSDIPVIEKQMKRLREKIRGEYKPAKRKRVHEKIKQLEEEIDKKTAVCLRNQRFSKEISELKEELRLLKNQLEKVSGKSEMTDKKQIGMRINQLEKEINAKTAALKKEAGNISKIEREIGALKKFIQKHKDEEKRKHEILRRIDPGVDLMADEVFDMSLNDIKAELSDRIRKKEAAVQQELNEDLMIREKVFKNKYRDLEKMHEKMYQDKIEKELKKKVQEKLNNIIKKKIEEKKAKLSERELRKLRKKASEDFERGKRQLKKSMAKELKQEKENKRQHFEEELLMQKHELHQKFEQNIADRIRKLRQEYGEKENQHKKEMLREKEKEEKLIKNIDKKKQLETIKEFKEELDDEKHNKEIERQKFREEMRGLKKEVRKLKTDVCRDSQEIKDRDIKIAAMENRQKEIKEIFKKERDAMIQKAVKEKEDIQEQIQKAVKEKEDIQEQIQKAVKEKEDMVKKTVKEKDAMIQKAVKEKVQQLRNELKKEFEEKAELELKKKELELEKKKIMFEQEIQKRAKSLFR